MNEKKPFSLLIIIFAVALFCSYHIYYHFQDKINNGLIENYNDLEQKNNPQNIVEKISNNSSDNNTKESYFAILKIPKINLNEGIYSINSKKNNVNNSVMILKESVMPSDRGSIIYLAAHSGSGYLAYFKDLNKLNIEDIINFSYQNNTYNYIINSIYETDKNGKITVNHNIRENYLVLTTCSSNSDKQLVITSKLISKI